MPYTFIDHRSRPSVPDAAPLPGRPSPGRRYCAPPGSRVLTGLADAGTRGTAPVPLNFAVFRSALAPGGRIGAGPFHRIWVPVLRASRRWRIASPYRASAESRPPWKPRLLCFALARDLGPIVLAALQTERDER